MKVTPIQRSTLVDNIVNQIVNQIFTGTLVPGTKLPSETDLAQELGVGRSSVRESLKVLEAMSLIERSREGPIIRSPKPEFIAKLLGITIATKQIDYTELLESREVIEVAVAGYAAHKASEEDIAKIAQLIDNIKSAIDNKNQQGYITANVEFHIAIAIAAKNRFLYHILEAVREALTHFQEEIYNLPEIHQKSLVQHQEIYNGIKSRDVSAARKAMKNHISYVNYLYQSKNT